MMKRYNVTYHNLQKVCGTFEHTYCSYNSLKSAITAAKKLWDNKDDFGGVFKVDVYDTQTPEGFPAKRVYAFR